jgi:MFS family permease
LFILVEARAKAPLMPLGLFRFRNLSAASLIGALWSAAMFAWFFVSALYMQLVLGYTPMQVGLAFLPANLIMAGFSLGLSARIVMRFGNRPPLALGLALAATGLALFAISPVGGNFMLHVLPAMTVLGIGCGMALNPILLVAMGEVEPSDSGLASGVVNTAFMMGGSLGLAVLASLSAARTQGLLAAGSADTISLAGGYQLAFVFGAIFAGVAALLSVLLLRAEKLAPSYKGA